MKWKELMSLWQRQLTSARVPETKLTVQFLAVKALGLRERHQLRHVEDRDAEPAQRAAFEHMVRERLERRTPIQYLVGEWPFHNVELKLRPPVLIPRPETEELVEWILESLRTKSAQQEQLEEPLRMRFLDIGCGSGCISLSILKAMRYLQATAIDVLPEAVELTMENARRLGIHDRITALREDISTFGNNNPNPSSSSSLPSSSLLAGSTATIAYKTSTTSKEASASSSPDMFDFVVSNPPYIHSRDVPYLAPEVRDHESWTALDGGVDGLQVARAILHRAPSLVRSGGDVWMELGEGHPLILKQWLEFGEGRSLGIAWGGCKSDLRRKNRFARFVVR